VAEGILLHTTISFVLLISQFMDIIVSFYDRAEDPTYSAKVYGTASQSSDSNRFTPWISLENQLKGNVLYAPKVGNKAKMPIVDTQNSDRSAERVVNVSQDSLPIACGILYCMSLLMAVLALVTMFSRPGDFVGDMGAGSGTFSNAAMIRRRHALALDFDKSQQAGLWNRLAQTQAQVMTEHERLMNSKDLETVKHYRQNIDQWNFVCNEDVHTLRAAVREELRKEVEQSHSAGGGTFLAQGSAAGGAMPTRSVESFVRVGEQEVAMAEMMSDKKQYNQAIMNSVATHRKELSQRDEVLRAMFCLNTCGIV
jgi:hypothetical protein